MRCAVPAPQLIGPQIDAAAKDVHRRGASPSKGILDGFFNGICAFLPSSLVVPCRKNVGCAP